MKKSQIRLIIKNWQPNFCKSLIKDGKGFLANIGKTAFLWEDALIEYQKQNGWSATKPNSDLDVKITINRTETIGCEIRTLTSNGTHFIQSSVTGSKATKEAKQKSLERKLSDLGDSGVFAIIDIRNADTIGANVYLLTAEDFTKRFGDTKHSISATEFDSFVANRLVDTTISRLTKGERYVQAMNVVRNSAIPLTKCQIEKIGGFCPFNNVRWLKFQKMFQDEIVVHPLTNKVHLIKSV